MSIQQLLMAGFANALKIVEAAEFDGTNDYLVRGAGLTGAADSKSGILSCWVRLDGGTLGILMQNDTTLSGGAAPRFQFQWSAVGSDTFSLGIRGTDNGIKLSLESSTTYALSATWRHVLMSWDVAVAAAHLYVNDVQDLAGSPTLTNATLDYTVADWAIAAKPDGNNKFDGCLSELYFAPGQYLDFSLVSNRRKFISFSGKPVYLGISGQLPTGTAPVVYQNVGPAEAGAAFALNDGTGGNFTDIGILNIASTSPSD